MVGLDLAAGRPPPPVGSARARRELPRSEEAAQPAVAQSTDPAETGRCRTASQMSSGLAGRARQRPNSRRSSRRRTRHRLVPERISAVAAIRRRRRPALPSGTTKIPRSAGMAERRPNTGNTRLGASAASEASCFATSTGCPPGSTATDVPTFRSLVRASAWPCR